MSDEPPRGEDPIDSYQAVDFSDDFETVTYSLNVRFDREYLDTQDKAAIEALLDQASKRIRIIAKEGLDKIDCASCGGTGHISLICDADVEYTSDDEYSSADERDTSATVNNKKCRFGDNCYGKDSYCKFSHPPPSDDLAGLAISDDCIF